MDTVDLSDDERAVRRAEWRAILNRAYDTQIGVVVFLYQYQNALVGRISDRVGISSRVASMLGEGDDIGDTPTSDVKYTFLIDDIVMIGEISLD